MKGKLYIVLALSLFVFVTSAAASDKSKEDKPKKSKGKAKVAVEEAKAGRDQELFRTGLSEIRSGHNDAGRIAFNTILNVYPDSPLVKVTKLAMSDSFYLEGGSKNLAQAESGYREWLQFFPDDALADGVRLKIAEIHMRQVVAYDRDPTHARQAERELKEILKLHPESAKKADVESRIDEIQEYLAMHELDVALFYYKRRESALAAQGRTEEILNKYPHFSKMDAALYYHARAMSDQEDTETAAADLARIVTFYPNSPYAREAKQMLAKIGKPIPEADPAAAAAPRRQSTAEGHGVIGLIMGPKGIAGLSREGVVIDRNQKPDELVARAQQMAGVAPAAGAVAPGSNVTSNGPDSSRPRRTQGQPGQDVEVKGATKDDKSKDKDKKKDADSSN